ncbi:MAG: MarR family transcriptional regulator [Alphaproteobacteria bacterium]|nr:MarR family winged helix-turn-helix transcriptional regulator [Alphaproteobacteria bacterium]TAD88248.1 MAG: MarR family transcriptional regulator [Alphaproteobacteria bacterium]
MTRSPTDSHIQAWARLIRASQRVLGAVEADLKAAGFPPLAWYDVLLELRRAEQHRLRPLDIEARLLLAQHNVSRLVDRLEKAGYVQRAPCAEDGRGQMVVLTDGGADLLRRMWPAYAAAIEAHVGTKLSVEEADQLAQLLAPLTASG